MVDLSSHKSLTMLWFHVNILDFRFLLHTTLNFPKGSTFGSKRCFQVTILKDIAYEGEKNFSLVISQTNTERLTIAPQRTTVVIKDHNGQGAA